MNLSSTFFLAITGTLMVSGNAVSSTANSIRDPVPKLETSKALKKLGERDDWFKKVGRSDEYLDGRFKILDDQGWTSKELLSGLSPTTSSKHRKAARQAAAYASYLQRIGKEG
ncbi:unnamed protein product [Phytophthora lilii]|uniref:Unnamed protein product n=1 Tax=Phytophthora lilii TaxID=2077276 RepID=A0A9W6XEN2_9STRA|nr:unnamed protein product [Phytophthora lilii]